MTAAIRQPPRRNGRNGKPEDPERRPPRGTAERNRAAAKTKARKNPQTAAAAHFGKEQQQARDARLMRSPPPTPPSLIRLKKARRIRHISFLTISRANEPADCAGEESGKNSTGPRRHRRPVAPRRSVGISRMTLRRISAMELMLSCRIPAAAAAAFRNSGTVRFFDKRYMTF